MRRPVDRPGRPYRTRPPLRTLGPVHSCSGLATKAHTATAAVAADEPQRVGTTDASVPPPLGSTSTPTCCCGVAWVLPWARLQPIDPKTSAAAGTKCCSRWHPAEPKTSAPTVGMVARLPPRRWYRVLPISELQYFVRPDDGLRGRIPGLGARPAEEDYDDWTADEAIEDSSTQWMMSKRKSFLRSQRSVPDFMERQWSLPDPSGFECDAFRNCCRICYDRPSDIVVLPCRHGAMCEHCVKRTLFSRPTHRGGRMCPFCRKEIIELLRIERDSPVMEFGYTIKAV